MPVQFPCERCRTTLSIARRKIGTQINCPRCGQGMRVPTEAEGQTRMLLAQSATSQPQKPLEDLLFSEFAVFDDEEGDAADPFTGITGASGQLPSPPLPTSPPLTSPPATPSNPPQPPAPTTKAPLPSAPPPVSTPPSAPPPPPDQPSEGELYLAPLTLVPEEDEAAPAGPASGTVPPAGNTPAPPAGNAPAPPEQAATTTPPPGKKESPRRWADSDPADSGQHSGSVESPWADPVAPPVQKSAPPVQRPAPPVASVPVASVPPVSSSTLTGRAASVVARQKAVKPVPGGWLLVPRRTIFVQGILIVTVGLLAFVAGWFAAGGGSGQPDGEQPAEAASIETVLVQGNLTYRSAEGRIEGDDGAVILIWPKDAFAEPRIDPTELHPSQAAPADGGRALLALEEIGAVHVRALSDGTFNLVVPRQGEYYVLFVSRRTLRSADEPVDEPAMNALRRVFAPATTGIDRQKYRLTLERFDTGLELRSHDFGRSGV